MTTQRPHRGTACVPECGRQWVILPSSLRATAAPRQPRPCLSPSQPPPLLPPHSAVPPLLSDLGSRHSQAPRRAGWSLGLDKPLLQAEPLAGGTPTHLSGNMTLECLPDLPAPSLPTFAPLCPTPVIFSEGPACLHLCPPAHEGPCPDVPSPLPFLSKSSYFKSNAKPPPP